MGTATVRINEKLLKEIQKWLDENGNQFQHPSITAFVNSAIYEKLKKENNKKEVSNGSK